MQQFTAVVAMYAWLAMTWAGRLAILVWLVPVATEAHVRGLERLQRAGLRRNVDCDGVRLECPRRAGRPDAAPMRRRAVS